MFRSISTRCRYLREAGPWPARGTLPRFPGAKTGGLRAGHWALALLLAAVAFAQGLHVEFKNGEYRLEGWTGGSQPPAAGWESIFAIYAGGSQTPMLGTYTVEGSALIFRPRFPLEPGVAIHGTFPGGGWSGGTSHDPTPNPHVEHIYPSADILPANTLRLYVYFSEPMNVGDALQHIRLIDDTGKTVPDAFLDQELWDPDHKRLTLLLDPGRIKRGLVPASEMGTAIQQGKHYTLIVSLSGEFKKNFIGGPADRTPADPKSWRITAPKAGTTEPLIVHFPKPMDYALLQRMLGVAGVRGTVAVGADETEWRFTPDTPWIARTYALEAESDLEDICGNHLEAESDLEDICGNHLDRPFDIDLHERQPAQPGIRKVSIAFVVK